MKKGTTNYLTVVLLCAFFFTATYGCYTATIETGLKPSTITIEKNWATGWLYGLVPPKTVETAAKCPNGVAKVVTQQSFLNMLAGGLTGGIYSPMTIKVTCAESTETSLVEPQNTFEITKDASSEEFQNVFMLAADKASTSKKQAFVIIHDKENSTKQE